MRKEEAGHRRCEAVVPVAQVIDTHRTRLSNHVGHLFRRGREVIRRNYRRRHRNQEGFGVRGNLEEQISQQSLRQPLLRIGSGSDAVTRSLARFNPLSSGLLSVRFDWMSAFASSAARPREAFWKIRLLLTYSISTVSDRKGFLGSGVKERGIIRLAPGVPTISARETRGVCSETDCSAAACSCGGMECSAHATASHNPTLIRIPFRILLFPVDPAYLSPRLERIA